MLLTLSTTHRPASDLSNLLHKHPDRFQTFGSAHVFYPELGDGRCPACVLLTGTMEYTAGTFGKSYSLPGDRVGSGVVASRV